MISALTEITTRNERIFSIGIDFCEITTFKISKKGTDLKAQSSKPQLDSLIYQRVRESHLFGYNNCYEPIAFGNQAREIIMQIKMSDQYYFINSITELISSNTNYPIPLLKVITDYLNYIFESIKKAVKSFSAFEWSKVQWVVGIKETTNQAKKLIREAFFETGMVHHKDSDKLVLCPRQELALIDWLYFRPLDHGTKKGLHIRTEVKVETGNLAVNDKFGTKTNADLNINQIDANMGSFKAIHGFDANNTKSNEAILIAIDFGLNHVSAATYKIDTKNNSYFNHSKPISIHAGTNYIYTKMFDRFIQRFGNTLYLYWCKNVPGFLKTLKEQISGLEKKFRSKNKVSNKIRVKKMILKCKDQDDQLNKLGFGVNEKLIDEDEISRCIGDDDSPINITLLKDGEIIDIIKEYYTTLLPKILALVKLHGTKSKKILIYGQSAESHHIIDEIPLYMKNSSEIVEMIIPMHPSESALRGATNLGKNQKMIQNRIFKYSYGTQYSKKYNPLIDDPTSRLWGIAPDCYIAAYLPFTSAGEYICEDKEFEQIVCPANDTQVEFPFGLYYSNGNSDRMNDCQELVTIIVAVPLLYRQLGKENRFTISMKFSQTMIRFTVVHLQSEDKHETIFYF